MRVLPPENRLAQLNRRNVSRRNLLRSAAGLAGATSIASFVAACSDDASDDDVAAEDDEEDPEPETEETADDSDDEVDDQDPSEVTLEDAIDELPEDFEPPDTVELDVDTLEADVASQTVEAEPYDNVYVGEVTEDLFIGVALGGGYPQGSDEVAVYLCDNELSIYLTDELDQNDEGTLSNDEAEVEFALEDGELIGSVTLAGEDPMSFTAVEAAGDAGMYAAEVEVENVEVTPRWIVLADGRQRGNSVCCVTTPSGHTACFPCYSMK